MAFCNCFRPILFSICTLITLLESFHSGVDVFVTAKSIGAGAHVAVSGSRADVLGHIDCYPITLG